MAKKVRDYAKLAADIKDSIGESNILTATHCATRLRLVLKETPDESVTKKIEQMPGVIQIIQAGGQYQIVIGTHAKDVYEHLSGMMTFSQDAPEIKESLINRVIAMMSGCIAPFVYVLAAAGLLQGVLIIIRLFADISGTGANQIYDMISWTPFTFLPVFIAVAGSRHFKCNSYIAFEVSGSDEPDLGQHYCVHQRRNSPEVLLRSADICHLYIYRHSAYPVGSCSQLAGAQS